jgi:hypothetical protein
VEGRASDEGESAMTDPSLLPRAAGSTGITNADARDPGLPRPRENGWPARAAEMAAIFMIGDGLIGLLQPRRHVDLWKDDALGTETFVRPFVDHPGRRRLYAVVQIAAGLALAARQKR